jgi:hypothetical protein
LLIRKLLETSGEKIVEQRDGLEHHAIPQTTVREYITKELRQNGKRSRHMTQEVDWTHSQVKWGTVDYVHALWVKPSYHAADGNSIKPDGPPRAFIINISSCSVALNN